MHEEILDIFDDNMEHIGTKPRSQVHVDGDWHKGFHCWIVSRVDKEESVVAQLRGPDKKLFPNALDITAAGHLLAGETIREGLRELEEELGIIVPFESLVRLGWRCEAVKIGDLTNREFDDVYLLRYDAPLQAYRLQEDEVSGLVRICVADGLDLFGGARDEVPAKSLVVRGGQSVVEERSVSVSDFIPRKDAYYLKIFLMAKLYFEGFPYLAI